MLQTLIEGLAAWALVLGPVVFTYMLIRWHANRSNQTEES